LLKVAAGGAAIRLVYTIYRQCNYDVFFIDWEKPRITISQAWLFVLISWHLIDITIVALLKS